MNLVQASIPFPQIEPVFEDHCRRVGGIADLIAHELFLSTEDKHLLHAACLLHHSDEASLSSRAPAIPDKVRDLLDAFWRGVDGSPAEHNLGAILRLSDAFDSDVQAQPFPRLVPAEILAVLSSGVDRGLWTRRVLDAFQACVQPAAMPPATEWHIPVFPQAAIRTMEAMRNPSVSIPQVVDIARRDPATAGCLMQLANSALYGRHGEVYTLQTAIARLGFETACKVVSSLALRPLLFLPKLRNLWPHSIQVADMAEQLAKRGNQIDPGEAYLAGLLHDVGRIALGAANLYNTARLHGLEEAGCPPVYAENLILEINHADLGAQIARNWNLPERLSAAIEHHHNPETGTDALPSLLYLAEYLTGSQEDLSSPARYRHALTKAGLTEEDLDGCARSVVVTWLAAA